MTRNINFFYQIFLKGYTGQVNTKKMTSESLLPVMEFTGA